MTVLDMEPRQPRKKVGTSLNKVERIELGAFYVNSDDEGKARLVAKWGKGRMRRCLREFANHEIEASFEAIKLREAI